MHYIRYDVLYTYVLARVRYWAKQAEIDEDVLLQRLLKPVTGNVRQSPRNRPTNSKRPKNAKPK